MLKGVKMLNLRSDDTVLVIGQGPIGLMHAVLASRTGARVLTSDLYPERHAIAAKYGLKDPIHAGSENVVERVLAETDGRGADAVILAVGGNALIKTAMDAARCGGKVMLFAQTQRGDATFDPGVVCMDEKTLMGSYSSSFDILERSDRSGLRRLPQRIRPDATHLASFPARAGRRGNRCRIAPQSRLDEDYD